MNVRWTWLRARDELAHAVQIFVLWLIVLPFLLAFVAVASLFGLH